jgi:hypothetical protein
MYDKVIMLNYINFVRHRSGGVIAMQTSSRYLVSNHIHFKRPPK